MLLQHVAKHLENYLQQAKFLKIVFAVTIVSKYRKILNMSQKCFRNMLLNIKKNICKY